jgi:uncharacterized pyridoxal phosphate-containing UPF0001 family protein
MSAELIHSVDSFELVEEINKRAEKLGKDPKNFAGSKNI